MKRYSCSEVIDISMGFNGSGEVNVQIRSNLFSVCSSVVPFLVLAKRTIIILLHKD